MHAKHEPILNFNKEWQPLYSLFTSSPSGITLVSKLNLIHPLCTKLYKSHYTISILLELYPGCSVDIVTIINSVSIVSIVIIVSSVKYR